MTTHAYRAVNAVAATLPASAVSTLRTDPAVATVVPDLPWSRPAPSSARRRRRRRPRCLPPQVCPTDPAKPLLEPEALSLTHTNSQSTRTTPTARSLGYDGSGVKVAFIADRRRR